MSERGVGEDAPRPTHGALIGITRPLAIAGGLLMIAAAVMVTVSVTMRWLFASSITGDFELVQMATALAVFAFLPLCQAARGNIVVDTFTNWMPQQWRDALDALWDIVYACAAAIIAWRLVLGALDTMRSNTVSMMLGLPVGWVIAACAAMATFLAVVAAGTAVALLRRRS